MPPVGDDDTVRFPAVRTRQRLPSWLRRPLRRYPKPATRPHIYGVAAVLLVFVGLFGVGAGLGLFVGAPALPNLAFAHAKPSGPAGTALARSAPTRIKISSIGVSAPIMTVGLAADGTIGTPPLDNSNLAAWYSGGPSPGEMGPAIIVGHVDGPHGESVFYNLGKSKPGETIQMDLADHKIATFLIYSVEYYPKGKFPGNRVYGDYSRPGLRIITCGGAFLGGSTGYADNIVVYASLQVRG